MNRYDIELDGTPGRCILFRLERKRFHYSFKLASQFGMVAPCWFRLGRWSRFSTKRFRLHLIPSSSPVGHSSEESRKLVKNPHLLLDHDGYLPSYAVTTDGRKSDIKVARMMKFAPGTVLVMGTSIQFAVGPDCEDLVVCVLE
ncbi:MAG: hypothetical protein DMG96_42325 [Acidobacteria bacterium]|nr:MAG: hypothetical protein DMG96_42325 [Acidobacteriota bacterium]